MSSTSSDILLVLVVGTALLFDFTNGFHDTANAVATTISTRAMAPRVAVLFAALLNFAGAFISLKVATTIAKGIVSTGEITSTTVFAGLIGAIAWNLFTWRRGLPSSSSHALIGGLVGAVLVADGASAINGAGLVGKVILPALISPTLAFAVAALCVIVAYRILANRPPGFVSRSFRLGQVLSSALLSLSHGTNDGQKTMGVITLALVAHGSISAAHVHVPVWVIASAATAMGLGTYAGGWRIIKTTGMRIINMNPVQGFATQGAGSAVILAVSHFGFPISTTHVINGGVMGAGAARRLSAVRWGVAGNIVAAWILTLPAAGLSGALVYEVTQLFGPGAVGPLVVLGLALAGLAGVAIRLSGRRVPEVATR
ncbi:MAG TPA: inorganic phosphate transporter [Solirubrobacteraceae bacterium]|nr:inorganic phosphate transporter [Solirubrobacteraceae bacterium]